MSLKPGTISRVHRTRRCDSDNIIEMTGILKSINDRVRVLLKKILASRTRLQERETKELQQLLRIQSKIMIMPVAPGIGTANRSLFSNQCYRVIYIKETIREIERRYNFKILNDY